MNKPVMTALLSTYFKRLWGIHRIACLCTVPLIMMLLWSGAENATAQTVTATPPNFVPEWDGVTDSTKISFDVEATSVVRVQVIDAKNRVKRVLLEGTMPPGQHETYWDGRDRAGNVLPGGRWRIRVTQKPILNTPDQGNAPGSAGLVQKLPNKKTAQVVVRLATAPVAIAKLQLSRGSLGKAKPLATTTARFRLNKAAQVSAAVINEKGQIIRTLKSGRMAAGKRALSWDGRDGRRRLVKNGNYQLLVSAADKGSPIRTIRTPLRVDRTLPKIKLAASGRAVRTSNSIVLPLDFTADKNVTLTLKRGKFKTEVAHSAGQKTHRIQGHELGVLPDIKRSDIKVNASIVDDTGNTVHRRLTLRIPNGKNVGKDLSKQPTPPIPIKLPDSAKPAPRLAWPVKGLVTSEFGPRWGRIHQGIDIGVPTGTPIYASAAGNVLSAGEMGGYGNQVTLLHTGGLSTRYAHMTQVALGLVAGDHVARGQLIGLSGCTGSCTGPHVHFETRVNDVAYDPRRYLE